MKFYHNLRNKITLLIKVCKFVGDMELLMHKPIS
jgi:hypothetical protein